jgi:predicted RNase H-like HicB family nuclease
MKHLKDYLELPYSVLLRKDSEGDFVARIEELPGCAAHGRTSSQALARLEEAKQLWISDCLQSGDPVPVPNSDQEPAQRRGGK